MKPITLKPLKAAGSVSNLPEDFESSLNDAQREAVFHDGGPMLVIAGAGSGKTKTLVYRVARLVASGVDPESILLLTFTRKSSQEMLSRASNLLDGRCESVSGGTFHGFANILLREFAPYLGFEPNFTILDRSDSEDLINMIRRELGYAKVDKRFPKKSTIASVIGKAVNTSRPVNEILLSEYPQFEEFTDDIQKIAQTYTAQKQAMQVMDYDDLLVQLCLLLRSQPNICDDLQDRYQYLLVDEYQDTNKIQAEILTHLAGPTANIMVVGDDSQSIYSFRGAHFKNIMSFPELFPGAKVVKLEQNYRSTQPILNLTNAMISRAREKYTKHLFTTRESDVLPMYVEADSEHKQSRFVTQKILELREAGISLDSMAVLIRSGWHSNDLEVQLKSSKIPFVKHGGFKFMETSHVKDVVSFMRIKANPLDSVSWNRILLMLGGVGPKSASTIIRALLGAKGSPPAVVLAQFQNKGFYKDLKKICELIFIDLGEQSPRKLLDRVMTYYEPLFKEKYDDFNKRQTDLESLEGIAERYKTLDDFLAEMTLDPPNASQEEALAEGKEDEVLTISTIHSAKGLEWKVVFILSAVDGYLPSFQSLGDLGQIEEERRLMYVALTRAEDKLFIIKPNLDLSKGNYYRYSGMQFSSVSRFLSEGGILDKYVEKFAAVQEKEVKPKMSSFYDSMYGDDLDDPLESSSKSKYRF